ncbi:DUF2254 domain-containing protein [Tenacibaculum tangerinum]|uniref:DUF2254 domain-containing protein n=1 Tax=Tenacibaculum tangerinum TaxID=3038772 RepID=A0ABY8L3D3_9FLAO|nr:DUF2254 domain-containing protein [Tenacibaculum tangerinum]WGH75137.1 DUF2254 domain-containing protein [Tenacibaculum tangerinum]
MLLRIKYLYEKLASSFWFLPSAILVINILLALLFIYLDKRAPIEPEGFLNLIFSKNPESGRNVLSIIAGSMAGIAGTVFSITLVILQLATSQLGPRLLKNFMYERINQVVLGQYIGLFLYCLIVINSVRDSDSYSFIPNLSIIAAIVFAIFNVFILIFYIHSVSVSIQPSKVIHQLGKNLKQKSDELYPDLNLDIEKTYLENIKKQQYNSHVVNASKSGYIQFFDLEALMKYSEENNCIIKVLEKPGAFIIKNQAIFEILKEEKIATESSEIDKLHAYYQVFRSKSIFQDTEFAIQQIVEIASRALSPGINDPHTAIICIDQLTSSLNMLAKSKTPKQYLTNDPNKIRLIIPSTNFKGFLRASFDEIRQFGAQTPSVIIRLMESIKKLIQTSDSEKNKEILKAYATLILETGEKNFHLDSDISDLRIVYNRVKNCH